MNVLVTSSRLVAAAFDKSHGSRSGLRSGLLSGPCFGLCSSPRSGLYVALVAACLSSNAQAGSYIFADADDLDIVTHPPGYTGIGGVVNVRVCIDPASLHAQEMEQSVINNIAVYNALVPTIDNIQRDDENDIPDGHLDFESVSLHEIGHCLGMAHPNLASESGLTGGDRNYTRTTTGANGSYDLDDGVDDVRGSLDDVRGDDENLFWFRKSNNNPFTIDTVVDSTTYSRDLADLPAGHSFAANPDRNVSNTLAVYGTEAVMQQGTFYDEAQRTLGHDDVATLRYAASGLDERESGGPANRNTMDNYSVVLEYGGISDSNCDISMSIVTGSGLGVCIAGGVFISSTHVAINSATIEFGDSYNWFFTSNNTAPEIQAIADQNIVEADVVNVAVSATDSDGDGLVLSATGLPSWASLTDFGDGTGNIELAPALGDAGPVVISVSVTDDGSPVEMDQASFTVNVAALDSDLDGISDYDEITIYGTLPGDADSDGDTVSDYDEIFVYGTTATEADSDSDGLDDGVELANGSNPLDDTSWPNFEDGDIAPLGAPDGVVNTADLLVMQRILDGQLVATPLELAHGDLYPAGNPDGVIDLSDLLLLHKLTISP